MGKPTQPIWCNKHSVIYEDACAMCVEGIKVCYKCKTTENLSKKTDRLMICRDCRNQYAREHSVYKPIRRSDNMTEHLDMDMWNKTAKETAIRISRKYAKA